MKYLTNIKIIPLHIAFLLFCSTNLYAAATEISGNFQQEYVQQNVLNIPETQHHLLLLVQSNGKNKDTSGTGFMEGADVNIQELIELNMGNGSNSGYVTQSMPNGDNVIIKISGNVSTVMSDKGTPNTNISGSWEFHKGTGKYEGISGSGSYTGYFTSEKNFVVDWQGFYY
jgi:hypothetical protein